MNADISETIEDRELVHFVIKLQCGALCCLYVCARVHYIVCMYICVPKGALRIESFTNLDGRTWTCTGMFRLHFTRFFCVDARWQHWL